MSDVDGHGDAGTDARSGAGASVRAGERGGVSPPDARSALSFPVELDVKAMGLCEPDFEPLVRALVLPHVPSPASVVISTRSSGGGKYVSVRVHFTATSRSQLETIYGALRAEPRVLFTL